MNSMNTSSSLVFGKTYRCTCRDFDNTLNGHTRCFLHDGLPKMLKTDSPIADLKMLKTTS